MWVPVLFHHYLVSNLVIMKSMSTSTSIIISSVIIAAAVLFVNLGGVSQSSGNNENVSILDGKQIVEITARGGYSPQLSLARANTPTILRVKTVGAVDCSRALSIPAIGYRQNLPLSGVSEIEIPPQKAGGILRGVCAMGMYSFAVNFE